MLVYPLFINFRKASKYSFLDVQECPFLMYRLLVRIKHLDGKSSQEYLVNAGAPQGSTLSLTLFVLYINDLPCDVIRNITIYTDGSTLYSKCADDTTLYFKYDLSSEIALYLWKSAIWPCMEYFCHTWACTLSCCLDMLNKLQERVYRIVGSSLAASSKLLAHRKNVAS